MSNPPPLQTASDGKFDSLITPDGKSGVTREMHRNPFVS